MPSIDPTTLLALQDELPKIASIAAYLGVAKNFINSGAGKKTLGLAGAMGGHGAAIGAGLGGLYKGYQGYSDARDQGADAVTAVESGLTGAAGGAMSGALYGGIAGGAAGGALGHYHPKADDLRKALSTEKNWTGALGRFGQRQMHGLTGWTPEGGLTAIRGGPWAARKALDEAKAGFLENKVPAKDVRHAKKVLGIEKGMEEANLTNLPGLVGALGGKGKLPDGTPLTRTEALKRMAAHQWDAQGTKGKALMLGMTAMPLLPLLSEQGRQGDSVGEQTGSVLGGTAGAFLGSALPFYAQQKVMGAGGYLGGKVGKGIDWLRGSNKHPGYIQDREQATSDGQHYPVERVPMSAGANGVMG